MSKNNKVKEESINEQKDTKLNLADTASLGRKKATDEEQQDYNFMGTLHNWTTLDEQNAKVNEIEKVTKEEVGHVKEVRNNNHGQWTGNK
jgi:hypothetical protein